jgi:hypothetical protein
VNRFDREEAAANAEREQELDSSAANSSTLHNNVLISSIPPKSILNNPTFPKSVGTGKRHITPAIYLSIMNNYATTTKTLAMCCEEFGVSGDTLVRLRDAYPDCMAILEIARARKVQTYTQEAINIWEEDIDARFWEGTKFGSRLGAAGVNYMRNKSEFMLKMAKITEAGKHNKDIEINITHSIGNEKQAVNLDEINTAPIEEISYLL